ncbi:keratin, type I cytoskeletal 19-like [Pelobates cultripes]|uniref:Keratin, type I cytoskeletal 19-like n=1 Tax=Pelobates cultripes TaxID=61616 RepID=A0AAD1SNF8_PELCU|nr:keratin, type I cytoskeletal 19-like [Pelobates cultripes]
MNHRFKQKNHCLFGSQFNQTTRNFHNNTLHHLGSYKGHHVVCHQSYQGGFNNNLLSYNPQYGGFDKGYHRPKHYPQELRNFGGVFRNSHHEEFQRTNNRFSNNFHYGGFQNSNYGWWQKRLHGENQHLHNEGFHQASRHITPPREHNVTTVYKHFNHRCGYDQVGQNYDHGTYLKNTGRNGGQNRKGFLNINNKESMKHLNERLSSYMGNIRSLAQENIHLKRDICEWYSKETSPTLPDSNKYLKIIEEIRCQISKAIRENTSIILETKKSKLAIDDLNIKYKEKCEFNSMGTDVKSLQRTLGVLNHETAELNRQVENLQQKIQQMRRDNEEKMKMQLPELGHRVKVEVKAASSAELTQALQDMRKKYEKHMEKNLRDAEIIFRQSIEGLYKNGSSGFEQIEPVQTELIHLKKSLQTLEIEFQRDEDMTSTLENSLEETQDLYASKLNQLQYIITKQEGALAQTRSEMEKRKQEYHLLIAEKTRLEMDITTYKHLLDGHDTLVDEILKKHGNCV